MTSTSIWRSGPGTLTLTMRPFGMFVMTPGIWMIASGTARVLPGVLNHGDYEVEVSAADVALLLTAPVPGTSPSLMAMCWATRHPAAPTSTWNWGMLLARGGTILPCVNAAGAVQPLDPNGFRHFPSKTFPAGKNDDPDFRELTLQ